MSRRPDWHWYHYPATHGYLYKSHLGRPGQMTLCGVYNIFSTAKRTKQGEFRAHPCCKRCLRVRNAS